MGWDFAGSPHALRPMSDQDMVGAMLFTWGRAQYPQMTSAGGGGGGGGWGVGVRGEGGGGGGGGTRCLLALVI